MADAAFAGIGIAQPDPDDLDPDLAAVEETEDGGAVVDFNGPRPAASLDLAFSDNLTVLLDDIDLGRLGNEIVELTTEDDNSRGEWKKTYTGGLALLGLKYEDRTEPWAGASGVVHPMLLESVIRFNAQAMTDLFPGAGPIKTKIIGKATDEKERQAERIKRDLNHLVQQVVVGYRDETDMMLFNLPLAGTTFRKWYYDEKHQRPAAEYLLPEHVVMPYAAASLASADRFAVILYKTRNWIESKMASGFYRELPLTDGIVQTTEIVEEKDRIEGKTNTNTTRDTRHKLYESHIDYFLRQDPLNTDDLPRPYIITVDTNNNKVLGIRRNWRETDAAYERVVSVVQHKYMPGFGPYGIGLINILGGLTGSATSILRQLIDAGVLKNLPAGYKTKGLRIKDDSDPIGPGEWRDVDVGSGTLRDSFFPLPYGEPSSVLAALLGQLVDEGRRIGSVADMKITDMTGQNMPVGTTLAIIERSMKVMSAVQSRLYESFKNEYAVLADIVKSFMGAIPYPFELDPLEREATRQTDYDDRVDIIPVADPNATTMAQRIMALQAVIQLSQSAPQIYDLKALHRRFINVLTGGEDADQFIPPDEETRPLDPVTENMSILTGKPVRAGISQDHEAHIAVHIAAARDPKLGAMLAENPEAATILSAAAAHIQEHLAFQYRMQIEEQLGVPLPPPDEPLPEDVEYELSRLVAAAAAKLFDKNKAEAKTQEIMDKLEDPIIQNERRSLDIKQQQVDDKRELEFAKLSEKDKDRALELIKTVVKEESETERSTIAVQVQKGIAATDEQLRMAEISADLGKGMLGEAGKLVALRLKQETDGAKKK